ncbi:MAG: hypothetical protein KDI15_10720 [Thiothrix sp.]|nr:hypothetical protein [Thiothrix sp.]
MNKLKQNACHYYKILFYKKFYQKSGTNNPARFMKSSGSHRGFEDLRKAGTTFGFYKADIPKADIVPAFHALCIQPPLMLGSPLPPNDFAVYT